MDSLEREAKIHEKQGDKLIITSPTQALSEYTTAIELYLKVASNLKVPAPQRVRCRTACETLITKAERLKRQTKAPEEKLSIKEETILLKSSKINGGKYPPLKRGTSPVIDGVDEFTFFLGLTKRGIQSLLGKWQRPREFIEDPVLLDTSDGGMYLVQDIITDCSLIASLCSASAFEYKNKSKIVTNNIFPIELSKSGKYIILLHLNGCLRQIPIDDYLPQSRTSKPLHVISKTSPNLVYPCLIEKAFLKVMGGYDFPGSNSATDLHILTGWIPEVVYLQEDEVDLDNVWKRVFRGWEEGNVLATVGTGSLTCAEEREFGIVGDHNYSIFDMIDRRHRRLLQVRNPWSSRGIPKSTFSTSELRDSLEEADLKTITDDSSVGTFWVEYATLSQTFKTLYLNWNPSLFQHSRQKHFSFTPTGSDFDIGLNGQYTFSVQGTGDVWILIERHYLGKSEGWEGYIGLAVFPGNERSYSYTRATYRTEYVDANYTLLKIPGLPANTAYTILVLANDKLSAPPQPPRFFTLTVYACHTITISDPIDALPHEVRVQGTWKKGISYKSPQSTFVENPQWKLVVPDADHRSVARVQALLESKDEETAVNVTIAWSAGKRLARLANQDILCQSGEYAPHHAKTSCRNVKLSTQYTIIASRFEDISSKEEPFTLVIRSEVPVTLSPLREEWAGKSRKQIESSWDPEEVTKQFILSTPRLTSFSVRLSVGNSHPFVRLSLRAYEEGGELVSSGEAYSDLSLGQTCSIEGFDLVGGEEYVLYVERLEDDEDSVEFTLDFLADGEIEPIEI